MFLISLSFVLIVAIALWQIRVGAFSALITLILASLSAAVALNYFEQLGAAMFEWTDQKRHPMYMYAASLILLFFVVQIALRFVFDLLVSSDVGFSLWPNRVVAGALGLLVGMVQVGVLMIALQMLPVGQSVFTHVAYKDDLTPKTGLIPFKPDRFVLGMVEAFSRGGLSDKQPWSAVHDDFLKEQFARRNQGWDNDTEGKGYQPKPGRVDAPPDAMLRADLYRLSDTALMSNLPQKSADVSGSSGDYYVARVEISSKACDVADEGNWYRLVGTHFELTAIVPNKLTSREERKRFYPVAFLVVNKNQGNQFMPITMINYDGRNDPDDVTAQPVRLVVERESGKRPNDPTSLIVDWVFLLPDGSRPEHITFRGGNRVEFPAPEKISKTQPPKGDALEHK